MDQPQPMDEQQGALIARSALPIDDIDQLLTPDGGGLIIVWADLSERPDLTNIGRENGEFVCTWIYQQPEKHAATFYLRIQMVRPTQANFVIGFKVARDFDQLSTLARHRMLWMLPGPPPAHLVGTRAMSGQQIIEQVVNVRGSGLTLVLEPRMAEELQARLAEWKRIK